MNDKDNSFVLICLGIAAKLLSDTQHERKPMQNILKLCQLLEFMIKCNYGLILHEYIHSEIAWELALGPMLSGSLSCNTEETSNSLAAKFYLKQGLEEY